MIIMPIALTTATVCRFKNVSISINFHSQTQRRGRLIHEIKMPLAENDWGYVY